MATLAAYYQTARDFSLLKGFFASKQSVAAHSTANATESVMFMHALAALSAKLAVVDGPVTKAEYQAFETLFGGNDTLRMRRIFLAHTTDRSRVLQYARQIADMTAGDTALHRDLFSRLVAIATADAKLNGAEMELLRVIATALGIDRDLFRDIIQSQLVPATSPYDVLGISSYASDEALRAHYMAQVQKLHPDRYIAAGASTETVALLSDQLAALNAAYQQIRAMRGKKGMFARKMTKSAKAAA